MKSATALLVLAGSLMAVLTLSACNSQAATAQSIGSAKPGTSTVIDVSAPSATPGLLNIAAPDFDAVDVVTGNPVSLKQFSGKVILLNLVNYGCNPTINDAVSAQLQTIRQLKQQGVDFVPLSVFCGCCSPDVLRKFAQQNNFDWPWVLDTDYSIAAKYNNYLAEFGYPTLIFIDRGGVIREYTGAIDLSTLTQQIAALATY